MKKLIVLMLTITMMITMLTGCSSSAKQNGGNAKNPKNTPVATSTPVVTSTPTAMPTAEPAVPTDMPAPTPTVAPTVTSAPEVTHVVAITTTPTSTPIPTLTSTPVPTITVVPVNTQAPAVTKVPTPEPTKSATTSVSTVNPMIRKEGRDEPLSNGFDWFDALGFEKVGEKTYADSSYTVEGWLCWYYSAKIYIPNAISEYPKRDHVFEFGDPMLQEQDTYIVFRVLDKEVNFYKTDRFEEDMHSRLLSVFNIALEHNFDGFTFAQEFTIRNTDYTSTTGIAVGFWNKADDTAHKQICIMTPCNVDSIGRYDYLIIMIETTSNKSWDYWESNWDKYLTRYERVYE